MAAACAELRPADDPESFAPLQMRQGQAQPLLGMNHHSALSACQFELACDDQVDAGRV